MEIVEKYQISQLHAFPFSAHIDHYGVPAGSYPNQVPNHIIQRRIKLLQKIGDAVFKNWAIKTIGKEVKVLVEKASIVQSTTPSSLSHTSFSGWTENYLACDETNFVPFPGQDIRKGVVVSGIYRDIIQKSEES